MAVWGGLVIAAFLVLSVSASDFFVVSPWEVISSWYLPLFVVIAFGLGWYIASEWVRVVPALGALIVVTFLQHSYLPLSHEFFYGADGWRHLANAERIVNEGWGAVYQFSSLGEAVGEVSYTFLWALLVASLRLGLNAVVVIKWLVPIVWSVGVPIVLYKLLRTFGIAPQRALGGVWLSLIPFAWQAAGAFTLPVGLSFVMFLVALVVLARYVVAEGQKSRLPLLGGLALVSVGYTLYPLVYLLLWGAAEALLFARRRMPATFQRVSEVVVGIGLLLALPLAEVVARYSSWSDTWSFRTFIASAVQFFGNLSGFYLASGPRPHDIPTGNLLFNQMPSYAFVSNPLIAWRWWLVAVAVVFWGVVVLGSWYQLRRSSAVWLRWWSLATMAFLGSLFVGRYVLVGEQVLSRRMDVVIVLFALVSFVVTLSQVFDRYRERCAAGLHQHRWFVGVAVAFAALVMGASYTLGPDTRAVSRNEYAAMQVVWSYEKGNPGPWCVVADTYPLLALEALSAKRIVGGGFPINEYFAQKEREEIFVHFKHGAFSEAAMKALAVTKAERCWFAGVPTSINPDGSRFFHGWFGAVDGSVARPQALGLWVVEVPSSRAP